MAILVVVSASTLLIFRGISRAWRTGTLRTERYQQARLLFDLFGRELSSSIASPRYPFVGLQAGLGEPLQSASAMDEVFFVGTLPGRAGFVERGYWVNAQGQLFCHDEEPADGDYATGESELCGSGVAEFKVSYFDGSEWVTGWDGRTPVQAGQLPRALHIVLSIGKEKPERFETVIYVPTS